MEFNWAPPGVDVGKPSVARIYDYLLGGFHNFASDREIARQAIAAVPDVAMQAQANRAFLHRAVRYLIDAGVRQFLDLGSGIPTLGNVHQIAQEASPDAAVLYVDIDPIAVAHSRHILVGNQRASVVHHDLRQAHRVLADAELHRVLDLSEPVAVLTVAVLHYIGDEDDPVGIVGRYADAVVPGSYLVIAHGVDSRAEESKRLTELSERTPTRITLRAEAEIEAMFDGFDLVEPGLVWAPLWRPESPHEVPERPELSANLVGVGRKP